MAGRLKPACTPRRTDAPVGAGFSRPDREEFMPVVINEFEVVPAPSSGAPSPQPAQPAPAGVTPLDVEQIVRRAHERAERVRAH